jgi:2-keto-4-pentenoate hydratase/2-oxohepta-3-ene-1,7-dioic acid hydratase in catechol pathway
LPPDGSSYEAASELFTWIEQLDLVSRDELTIPTSDVRLLVPIANPPKMLFLAGNYAKHVAERGGSTAEREETFPYVFMKPPSTTLTHPGDPILIPKVSPGQIDWECELAIVIGRQCRHVDEDEAMSCVAGYTIINDISDRSFKPNPGRKPRERDKFFDWMHGKWHDTFCPMGPCILSADVVSDPQAIPLKLTVNGHIKQDATTAEMIFPVPAIVAFLSEFVTLQPGDVIATGTPSGVGSASGTFLRAGDYVRATIGPIGVLENPIEAEDDDDF